VNLIVWSCLYGCLEEGRQSLALHEELKWLDICFIYCKLARLWRFCELSFVFSDVVGGGR
jgi:hypothetical protein